MFASFEELRAAWKSLDRYSERQLGAYVLAHLLDAGRRPRLLPEDQVKFRNNVIHRGYIPFSEEAIHFGNSALEIVSPCLSSLKAKYGEVVQAEVVHHMRAAQAHAMDMDRAFSGMTIAALVSIAQTDRAETVEAALGRIGMARKGFAALGQTVHRS
jgi:hypothetical protein